MTQEERNEILRHIEVEKAYLDGQTIELKSREAGEWTTLISIPSWDWLHCDYRIKPAQYRPFENKKELMDAVKEHGGKVLGKRNTVYRMITAFSSEDVKFGTGKFIGYKDAYAAYTFVDGTPFGKLIEK